MYNFNYFKIMILNFDICFIIKISFFFLVFNILYEFPNPENPDRFTTFYFNTRTTGSK